MNEVQELIRTLEDSDIRLEVVEDRLRIDAPKGALTADLRRTLESRKSELINALRRDWAADARKVIAALPDQSLRPLLTAYFEQTTAYLQHETGCQRLEAEMQSFGLLVFQLIRLGITSKLALTN